MFSFSIVIFILEIEYILRYEFFIVEVVDIVLNLCLVKCVYNFIEKFLKYFLYLCGICKNFILC